MGGIGTLTTKHGADVLGTLWDVDPEEFLDGERVALLIGHHRDVVQAIKVWECLRVSLVFNLQKKMEEGQREG